MNSKIQLKLALKLSLLFCLFASTAQASVNGTDDRALAIEALSNAPEYLQKAINATAALVTDGKLQKNSDGKFQLVSNEILTVELFPFSLTPAQIMKSDENLAQTFGFEVEAFEDLGKTKNIPNMFCRDEKFAADEQESSDGVFCTAILISDQHILTAGHCIDTLVREPQTPVHVVFGYTQNDKTFTEKNIYHFSYRDIKKTMWSQGLYDYGIIKLDRKVEGIEPVVMNLEQDAVAGSAVTALGFPFGFPMILSEGKILSQTFNRKPHVNQYTIIKSDLDVFPGNSGGPVFDEQGRLLAINTMVTRPYLGLDLEAKCYRWFQADSESFYTQSMPLKLIKNEIAEALLAVDSPTGPKKSDKKKKKKKS